MAYLIVGLGNPGEDYVGTRHNVGRELVEYLRDKGELAGLKYYIPDQFMNNSGKGIDKLVKSKKAIEQLVVVHDDLDLPLGTFKMSFNKGPGGHRGVLSVMKALKTEAFIRVRIGVSPTTLKGKLKKPSGEDAVVKFILGKLKPTEQKIITGLRKKIKEALTVLLKEGKEKAMSLQY